MLGVNSRAERGVMQHYISDSIYGLMLAWITSENSTKQLECRHLDSIFFAGPYLMLPRLSARVSTVDRLCPCPFANCCQLLFPTNSLFASRYHFRIRRDFRSKNTLSGFAPKQTKESSAWRATHIVLHRNDICKFLLVDRNKHVHMYESIRSNRLWSRFCFVVRFYLQDLWDEK